MNYIPINTIQIVLKCLINGMGRTSSMRRGKSRKDLSRNSPFKNKYNKLDRPIKEENHLQKHRNKLTCGVFQKKRKNK